ncbi:MAG: acyltransferase [Pseudomonadales bacterium]
MNSPRGVVVINRPSQKLRLRARWQRLWMRGAGANSLGRLCCRLAGLFGPQYKGLARLASMTPNSFIAPDAVLENCQLELGRSVFLGPGVVVYGADDNARVSIGDKSCLHKDTIIETGKGGRVEIGPHTHIQPRCQLSAYCGSILIGGEVQIAPACAFYPYNHGFAKTVLMRDQPLESRGDIVLEDDVWLGYGVTILENVRIGKGAVIAAGSVVRSDIPANAIAAGVPARVVGQRK